MFVFEKSKDPVPCSRTLVRGLCDIL